jgi:hypothetical protein
MTQGYGTGQGYAQQPPPPRKKSLWWVWLLVGAGLIPVACIGIGIVGAVASKDAATSIATPASPGEQRRPAAEHEPDSALNVSLGDLLSEYKDNEIRADGQYKGKRIRVSGTVGDVKKDILSSPYVIVGTGKQFEIPTVQCSLRSSEATKAAGLSKGSSVTVSGKVGGLMMNVQLRDCTIE